MANEFDQEGQPEDESITRKPRKGGFKDTAKRLRQGKESHLSHRASLDWRTDHAIVCGREGASYDQAEIAELVGVLMKSRTAAALLEDPAAALLEIRYDMQNSASQYYPPEGENKEGAPSPRGRKNPVITLNPHRTRGDLINMLARELRRMWQHHHGALVNPLLFEPDEAILINRAQAADTFMMTVKVAWELKLAGEQEAWNHISGSPMADIGRSFELKAQADFRTLNNGTASRAAYDKFFEDSRTKYHDKSIIHQMLLDESGYMRTKGEKPRVSSDLFRKLGELPGGRNYFAVKAGRTPMDSSYAAVEDRSNANFLWFIKFERSFQEREMQMVQESVKLSAEIVDFARWSMKSRGESDTPGL